MGYSAKGSLTGAMTRLVSPFSILLNFDGCGDVPNMLYYKEHFLSSLTTGVKSDREDSDAHFQYHIKKVISCTSKEDGRKFVLLYIRRKYQSRSTSILAVNCNPLPGTKTPSTPHFRATIVKAYSIVVPFYGRTLLSFNGGKHAFGGMNWQLVRYERIGEFGQPHGPFPLANFNAMLTMVNTEKTPNYDPTIQQCRCFVGATWELLDRVHFRDDEFAPLIPIMYDKFWDQVCRDEVSRYCVLAIFSSIFSFQKCAKGRDEMRAGNNQPRSMDGTAQCGGHPG
jgi:hypothetical protein